MVVHVSDEISPPNDYCKRNVIVDMDPAARGYDGMQLGQSYTARAPRSQPKAH